MRPPLFILSSGRSGSTLLQRILNTWDDVTVWGEHGGFLRDTAAAWFRLLENPGNRQSVFPVTEATPIASRDDILRRKHPAEWQAWINFFTEESVHESFRRHVESFFRHSAMGDDHVWGFKEIRYGGDDRVIEFLHAVYPDALFVFLSRSVYDTLASQMKAFKGTSGLAARLPAPAFLGGCRQWRDQNASLLDWHESGRLRSFWIRFEELAESLEPLQPVAGALGKSLGPEQEAVLQMSEGRGAAFRGSTAVHERWKSMSFAQRLAVRCIAGRLNDRLGHPSPWSSSGSLPARPTPVAPVGEPVRSGNVTTLS